MLKRTLSSIVIVLVALSFFLLRLIDYRFFVILIYMLALMATYELITAYKDGLSKLQKLLVLGFTATVIPLAVFYRGYVIHYLCVYFLGLIAASEIFDKTENANGTANAVFCMCYPTLPLLSLVFLNAFSNYSLYLLVSLLITTSLTDVGAYLVGSLLKGPKLCPKISPNKTVSGAIGGLVFAIISSIGVYFIFKATGVVPFATANIIKVIIFLVGYGVLNGVATEVGDLTESRIKRKLGVKDMGNLIPGHGGILDRIDGLTFSSLATFVLYSLFL